MFMRDEETLFGKFEFEQSFHAQLRTHAQAGAESVAAYAARTTDICLKAYPAFAMETALPCFGLFQREPDRRRRANSCSTIACAKH